jgi:hypothetical protein
MAIDIVVDSNIGDELVVTLPNYPFESIITVCAAPPGIIP